MGAGDGNERWLVWSLAAEATAFLRSGGSQHPHERVTGLTRRSPRSTTANGPLPLVSLMPWVTANKRHRVSVVPPSVTQVRSRNGRAFGQVWTGASPIWGCAGPCKVTRGGSQRLFLR